MVLKDLFKEDREFNQGVATSPSLRTVHSSCLW